MHTLWMITGRPSTIFAHGIVATNGSFVTHVALSDDARVNYARLAPSHAPQGNLSTHTLRPVTFGTDTIVNSVHVLQHGALGRIC
jgi:hypothetical protein